MAAGRAIGARDRTSIGWHRRDRCCIQMSMEDRGRPLEDPKCWRWPSSLSLGRSFSDSSSVACLLLAPPRIAPIARNGMMSATPWKLPSYARPWTHDLSVIPRHIRLCCPVPAVFRAAFGLVAQWARGRTM